MIVLGISNGLMGVYGAFFIFGLTVGAGGPIKAALWAELFGTQHLGAIKSALTTVVVISTAISPILFAWILNLQHDPNPLLYSLAGISIAFSIMSAWHLKSFFTPNQGSKTPP